MRRCGAFFNWGCGLSMASKRSPDQMLARCEEGTMPKQSTTEDRSVSGKAIFNIHLVGASGVGKGELLQEISNHHEKLPKKKKGQTKKWFYVSGHVYSSEKEQVCMTAYRPPLNKHRLESWKMDNADGAILLMNINEAKDKDSYSFQVLKQLERARIPFFIVLTEVDNNGAGDMQEGIPNLTMKFVVNSSWVQVSPFRLSDVDQRWSWCPTDSPIKVPYTIMTSGTDVCYTEEIKKLLGKLMDIFVVNRRAPDQYQCGREGSQSLPVCNMQPAPSLLNMGVHHHYIKPSGQLTPQYATGSMPKKSIMSTLFGKPTAAVAPGHVEMYEMEETNRVEYGMQTQAQHSAFRSIQASKQMLYDVWKNCMGALEEFEQFEVMRDHGKCLERSVQPEGVTRKDIDEARQVLTTHLIILKTHLSGCRDTVLHECVPLLKKKTLLWTASRVDDDIFGETDKYAATIIEILMTGKTTDPLETRMEWVDHDTRNDCVQKIFTIGMSRKDELDRQFRDDPMKKAQDHPTRRGSHLSKGAGRIVNLNPDLEGYLKGELDEKMDLT